MTNNDREEELQRYGHDCGSTLLYISRYSIPQAAALWCGVPPDEVDTIIEYCRTLSPGIISYSDIPCIEKKCRALHEAIDAEKIPFYKETGGAESGYLAPQRRRILRQDLKNWIAENYPNEKPSALFDELERSTHSVITTETFQALQAERDAIRTQLESALSEKDKLLDEIKTLNAKPKAASTESGYKTMLKLILAMAIDKYNYDPDSSKNTATGENNGSIKNALEMLGLNADTKTIKRYLDDAVAEYPEAKAPKK